MQDTTTKEPTALKPYIFHGMELSPSSAGEYIGECPFCGKYKFHASPTKGLFDCKVCGEKGNAYNFLRKIHAMGMECTLEDDYLELMEERGILSPESVISWGVCRSPITDEWLLPAYGVDGALSQLYKFVEVPRRDGKGMMWVSYATPRIDIEGEGEIRHQLFGANLVDKKSTVIYVCEGFWDGVCLWETLANYQRGKVGPRYTEVRDRSYLAHSSVVAVPGAQTFRQVWCPLFAGKDVIFCYDNDHPKRNKNNSVVPPSGLMGTKKAIRLLLQTEVPPTNFYFIKWDGNDGKQGFNTDMPDGLDVRDVLTESPNTMEGRGEGLDRLLKLCLPFPNEWLKVIKEDIENTCKPIHCTEWKVLVNAWKKALKWTKGLDITLSFMMSIAASTDVPEDQIWGKVMSPPSTGKSTLCEAFSVSRRHVHSSSTMKSFYSGYKTDKEGTEDYSTIKLLKDKTLVIKDGDTLLQNPKRDEILAQARDLYDRVSRSNYANALNRVYEGYNITIILCGTSALRILDASELGQRFLDCIIMDEIDEEMELSINRRKQNSIRQMMLHINNGHISGRDGETRDLMEAKGLTAGYLDYLRSKVHKEDKEENERIHPLPVSSVNVLPNSIDDLPDIPADSNTDTAQSDILKMNDGPVTVLKNLLSKIEIDDVSMNDCNYFGSFIAYFRSRPSKKQDEEMKTRELSTRLVCQLTKLAYIMAAVMGKKSVDNEVMYRIRKITLDTARGNTFDIVRHIFDSKSGGLDAKSISIMIKLDEKRTLQLLRFLQGINVVEMYSPMIARGVRGNARYRLTDRVRSLYMRVINHRTKDLHHA